MGETIEISVEKYNRLMEKWCCPNKLDSELYDRVKFFKRGLPEAHLTAKGQKETGNSLYDSQGYIALEEVKTGDWEEFKEEVSD